MLTGMVILLQTTQILSQCTGARGARKERQPTSGSLGGERTEPEREGLSQT